MFEPVGSALDRWHDAIDARTGHEQTCLLCRLYPRLSCVVGARLEAADVAAQQAVRAARETVHS